MLKINDNERSVVIDMISYLNSIIRVNDLKIKMIGGERTLSTSANKMFPDVILYSDENCEHIIHGWEIKMPDTPLTNETFINDAKRKAEILGSSTFFIWNFTAGALYEKNEGDDYKLIKQWNDTYYIKTRDDVTRFGKDWEESIKNILFDLNEYFISIQIHSSSMLDIVSEDIISNIIKRNKKGIANTLLVESNTNAVIKSNLSLWWQEVKNEYFNDEENMYYAYAKNILLHWSNRILFAHLIKRNHNKAFLVNEISYDTSIDYADDIFETITDNCDFYNIFHSINYNTLLTEDAWSDLVELNQLLIDFNTVKIDQATLQNILENTVNNFARLINGQFPTPEKLAKILSNITLIDWSKNCIDPCCGTGTIAKAVLKEKMDKFSIDESIKSTWACDKCRYPLQIASISLASPDTIDLPNRVFQHNVFDLSNMEYIELINPRNGNRTIEEMPKFSYIISNLPFVSFDKSDKNDYQYLDEIRYEVQTNTGIVLDHRNDYYSYIIFSLYKILLPNGRMGIITSNSWLGTLAGKKFYEALNYYYDVDQVHISGTTKWFKNADVITVILILTKKDILAIPNNEHTTSFYKWNKSLDEVQDNKAIYEDIINSSLLNKTTNDTVISLNKYTYEQIVSLQELNLSLNSLFHNVLWLLKIKDCITPIDNLFKVIRGERRGWDKLFYPQSNHNIEPIFIKKVLKNSRNLSSLIAVADKDAFCCSLSEDELLDQGYNGALRWINKFSNEVNKVGKPLTEVLATNNKYWYEMKNTSIADICTSMNPDQKLFFAKFETPAFINQRLIGLQAIDKIDIELCHALLNSLVGMFYLEAIGFGRGLGALDINKTTLSHSFMLNPELLTKRDIKNIKEKFNILCQRDIYNVNKELDMFDREQFDRTVLKAFDIEEYYDDIKQSLLSMHNTRLAVISL